MTVICSRSRTSGQAAVMAVSTLSAVVELVRVASCGTQVSPTQMSAVVALIVPRPGTPYALLVASDAFLPRQIMGLQVASVGANTYLTSREVVVLTFPALTRHRPPATRSFFTLFMALSLVVGPAKEFPKGKVLRESERADTYKQCQKHKDKNVSSFTLVHIIHGMT